MCSEKYAIRVNNLSKCYRIYEKPQDRLKHAIVPRLERLIGRQARQFGREFWALDNVSFDVAKGEVLGIVGQNGSGKSTLLQIICGTLSPTSGCVEVRGRVGALLELGAGFNPEFTGRENVYMNGAILGMQKKDIDERFESIEAFADIGNFIDQPVKTYSSGMFVRLAFAIQSHSDPDVLIVDEALAVGDGRFVHRCMLRFHELVRKGVTILLVTHDSSAIKRLCGRALWLRDGAIIRMGRALDVVDDYQRDLFDIGHRTPSADEVLEQNREDGGVGKLFSPSGDQRFGEGRIKITGISLFDSFGHPTGIVGWNETVTLVIELRNYDMDEGQRFSCGYIVRDSKGIEIASANTRYASLDLVVPRREEALRVMIDITFPMLHPGHYALTPSVSSISESNDSMVQDRILNAIDVKVTTTEEIGSLMRFPTQFTVARVDEGV